MLSEMPFIRRTILLVATSVALVCPMLLPVGAAAASKTAVLNFVFQGTGSGTVTMSATSVVGSGNWSVTCRPGAPCSLTTSQPVVVRFTATADAGSTFAGWGPPCSGTVCKWTIAPPAWNSTSTTIRSTQTGIFDKNAAPISPPLSTSDSAARQAMLAEFLRQVNVTKGLYNKTSVRYSNCATVSRDSVACTLSMEADVCVYNSRYGRKVRTHLGFVLPVLATRSRTGTMTGSSRKDGSIVSQVRGYC